MELKGPVEAPIGVGSVVEWLKVYVTNLDELVPLGLDYMTRSKVNLGWKLVGERD